MIFKRKLSEEILKCFVSSLINLIKLFDIKHDRSSRVLDIVIVNVLSIMVDLHLDIVVSAVDGMF